MKINWRALGTIVVSTTLFLSGCFTKSEVQSVVYLIPRDFVGAVVIIYEQKNGEIPEMVENSNVFIVPDSGVIKSSQTFAQSNGRPRFYFGNQVDEENRVEYIYPGGPKPPAGARSFRELSDEEQQNEIFVMNYEQGSFNVSKGRVQFRSFLVCKPKDGNLYASRDLNEKIADIHKLLSQQ